jgi:hypothetical protein
VPDLIEARRAYAACDSNARAFRQSQQNLVREALGAGHRVYHKQLEQCMRGEGWILVREPSASVDGIEPRKLQCAGRGC